MPGLGRKIALTGFLAAALLQPALRTTGDSGRARAVTAGLVVLVFALARTPRGAAAAPAIGAYIGAAYWFTSSTSFANPAVTIARMFSNTFAGIAPGSVPGFIVAQVIGGVVGVGLVLVLYPHAGRTAGDVVVPHSIDR